LKFADVVLLLFASFLFLLYFNERLAPTLEHQLIIPLADSELDYHSPKALFD
jgi:hypothetical protein